MFFLEVVFIGLATIVVYSICQLMKMVLESFNNHYLKPITIQKAIVKKDKYNKKQKENEEISGDYGRQN